MCTVVFGQPPEAKRFSAAEVMVIVDGGVVLATCVVEPQAGDWYIWLLAVDIVHRRRGFGRNLLTAAVEQARHAGASQVRVKTYQTWTGMQALLRATGWCFVGAEPGNHRDGVAEIWLLPVRDRRLRIGVVGANPHGRGGEWLEACQRCRWADLVGIADTSPACRDYWSSRGISGFPDTATLLHTIHPEAVVVAVPPGAMRPVQEACLEAGVAMLHEKPLAGSLADLSWLQSAIAHNPVPLVVGVQRRSHPSYVFLRSRILTARPSRPSQVVITLHLGRKADEAASGFRADLRMARGGALIDLGYHALDLAQWLLDAPLEFVACTLGTGEDLACGGAIETRAALLARSGPCWVRININRHGANKMERVEVALPDGLWIADRNGVDDPMGRPAFRCQYSWAEAELGCLATLSMAVAATRSPPDLWDHLASLEAVERAYGAAAHLGLGRTYV